MDEDEVPEKAGASSVPILSVVYRLQTLGVAFLDQTTLRFCQVADAGPELGILRSLKFELNPELIIAPANSDANFLQQLEAPLESNAAPNRDDELDPDEAVDDGAAMFSVSLGRSRDFTSDAAAKRLVLLTHLFKREDEGEMTDREALIHLEHHLPREQEQARQAVGGLLSYMQRAQSNGRLSISDILQHKLEHVMRLSPEVLLSLNIFPERRSALSHGGRSRDGFSLWAAINMTRSTPGEALLRSWFARPSLDLAALTERHEAVAFFLSRQDCLPQLRSLLGKAKDVRNLRASFDRGGLLLSDFKNALSTASCTIRMRDLLQATDAATEGVPIAARLEEARGRRHTSRAVAVDELAELSNMIAGIIDFEASAKREARATRHICVHDGVHEQLDSLRESCARLPHVLTSTARTELARLKASSTLLRHNEDEQLYIVFITQLGFMLKMPMPRVLPENADSVAEQFADAGLALQFHEEGSGFFKTHSCLELDRSFGDILSRIRDLESQLVRHLELQILTSLPAMIKAQAVLAELDCLLSLALAALELKLTRPTLVDGAVLDIKEGWHPLLHNSQQLVPNSCRLCVPPDERNRMLLLTGPNASGKTFYLRMVGLITFLAHIGSFVPAESATIGLTDAIFTRMISHESTVANASAFMVDLTQMALMMRHSTQRSLCLMDEFGKGTNAQDGISHLYACLRHFLDRGDACPRLLACTHFTELLELPELVEQPGLSLWTMQVMLEPKRETDDMLDQVVFLYRAVPGQSEDSYGYHCASAADVPKEVIDRALHISQRRDAGEPIYPIHRDKAEALAEQQRLEARDALVDGFFDYDFSTGTAADFFGRHAQFIAALTRPTNADADAAAGTFC